LEIIELNKWTKNLTAFGNPIQKLILHEHYGTGRTYNFQFTHVNEIVFFVHEHCCTLENLENFYILIHSFGDLSTKKFDVNDWSCKYEQTVTYETKNGFITNNVCTKIRGIVPVPPFKTSTTTTTTTNSPFKEESFYQVRHNITMLNRIQNAEDFSASDEDINAKPREKLTTIKPLFSGNNFDINYDESTENAFIEESTTRDPYEEKAETGIMKTIKKKVTGWKDKTVRKWNEWFG
jgi:hypothetical protein